MALTHSPKMPVLFLGHGSPMNVITDNPYREAWRALGEQFGTRWPRPRLILCVSAHWLTHGWWLTGQAQPRTIHDFGGFPQELFDQQYPAPGAPEDAAQISALLQDVPVGVDAREWGYDHGSWGVLKPMFPQADIPVLQLSLNWDAPPADHLALGQRLRPLRELGVLVIASGNTVHNLRAMRREATGFDAYDWAIEFDTRVGRLIEQHDDDALADFQALGEVARLSHPSYDHYLPLLHAAGAADATDPVSFFCADFQGASVAMRSVIWG